MVPKILIPMNIEKVDNYFTDAYHFSDIKILSENHYNVGATIINTRMTVQTKAGHLREFLPI